MTPRDEVRQRLLTIDQAEFQAVTFRFRDYSFPIESNGRQGIVDAYMRAFDRNVNFALELCRILNITPPQEYDRMLNEREVIANEEAAEHARKSAEAAETSNFYAKWSTIAAGVSVIAALLTLVLALADHKAR